MKAINSVVGTIQCEDKASFAALIHELVEMQSAIDESGHSVRFEAISQTNLVRMESD